MICPSCRARNEPAARTCLECGQSLPSPSIQGKTIASRYKILSSLGKGGMGTVYKALDRVLDETIALKVMRPEFASDAEMARRFVQEVKLARKVTHKNVCRIYDMDEEGDLRYLAMEFIAGTDLKQVLRVQGGLLPEGAFEVAIEIATGLQAIHEVGIIHRDLKTPNIMLDSRGVVRLMDFGVAKISGGLSEGTATGMILGTPEYMSPEQARGEGVDFRTDIYALGIVIFEVFTGRLPFTGDTAMAILYKQVHEPPPLEGSEAELIPAPLVPVLRKTLAKDPAQRYASARDLVEALRHAQSSFFAPTPRAQPMPPPPRCLRAPLRLPFLWMWTSRAGLLLAIEEVTSSLKEDRGVQRLLNLLAALARRLSGAQAARVLIFKGDRDLCVVEASLGDEGEDLRGVQLTAGEGIAPLIAEGGKPLLLADPAAHPRFSRRCDALSTVGGGFLGVPLLFGTLRGAVVAAGRQPAFDPRDLGLLARFAQVTAGLVEGTLARERSLDAFTHTSEVLLSFLERMDVLYPDHSRTVAALADMVAPRLGLSEDEQLQLHFAALLHDIGKVRLDPAVLQQEAKLSETQRRLIEEHVVLGVQLLAPISPWKQIPEIIHSHHERWDGKGYPRGLSGELIPLGARIVAVADAFDAMTSQGGQSPEEVLEALERCGGTQFDSRVVQVFVAEQRSRQAWFKK